MTDPADEGLAASGAAGNGGNGDTDVTIDWDEIRKRLKRLRSRTDQGGASAVQRRKVLHDRAVVLAQGVEHAEVEGDKLELLEFVLGDERYTIDSAAVREVYALKEITPVPGTPPHILGVISVRGRIVSVVDLGRLFDSPPRDTSVFTMAIVLKSSRMEFALLADSVNGICYIPVADLQASLPTLTGSRKKYLRGVTSERVTVLDAHRLLGDDTLVVRHERGGAR
jgi:purine-binding chemotaxis protein CheW